MSESLLSRTRDRSYQCPKCGDPMEPHRKHLFTTSQTAVTCYRCRGCGYLEFFEETPQ